jgi:hypothetical protein
MTALLPKMGQAFGPHQYGAGRAGGAERELYEVRASLRHRASGAANVDEQWVIATLDLTNAFGNVQWAHALEVACKRCPGVAPLLAAMWATQEVTLHVQQQGNHWMSVMLYGSLLQGGLEGHPRFCVVLWDAMETRLRAFDTSPTPPAQVEPAPDDTPPLGGTHTRPRGRHQPEQTPAVQLPFQLWLYVDDITVHCPVKLLKEIVTSIQDAVTQDLQGSVNCS